MMELHANTLAGGLLIGIIYGLIAFGLSIMFGVMRVVNFAHGEMVVAGMYVGYLSWEVLGVAPLYAVPFSVALSFVFGYALQRFLVNDFMLRPQHTQFTLFIGIALLITGFHAVAFGADPRGVDAPISLQVLRAGPLNFDIARVQAAVAALVMIVLLTLFLNLSPIGLAIRAAADNQAGAKVIGIRIPTVFAVTAGIGVACAGAAGTLISPMFAANPYLAAEFTLLAFITVIVGGLGSLRGALVGGVLIGMAESSAALIFHPSMKTMFSFALLFVVMLVRPQGLFGARRV